MLFDLIHIYNALAELVRYIIKSVIFRIPVSVRGGMDACHKATFYHSIFVFCVGILSW